MSSKAEPGGDSSWEGAEEAEMSRGFVRRSWITRFSEQFAVLFYKNVLVNVRNYRATLLRLLSPLFFMFLLWLIELAIIADNPYAPVFQNNPNPSADVIDPIPNCSSDVFIQTPCYDFMYTPNTSSAAVEAVVNGMMANNPGRVIPLDRVMGFAGIEDTNSWLLANPERTTGVVHFMEGDDGSLSYSLQTNSTIKFFKGDFQDPTFYSLVPLQNAVEREIGRYYWQQAGKNVSEFSWSVSTAMFAHPTTTPLNIVGYFMGPFVFATNMFSFVMLLSAVVAEKEAGLRQALRTMGMMDSAFWLSWMAVEVVSAVIFTLVLIGFGAAFQFNFFLLNSFGLVFFLFFLFQLAMISVSFLLSTLVAKSSSAVYLGFVIFIIGWIIQSVIAFDFPYTPEYIGSVPVLTVIFALMPWSLLAKGSLDLGNAALDDDSPGISWSDRSAYCMDITNPAEQAAKYQPNVYQDFECVMPLTNLYFYLLLEYIIYFLLAIYLDNVLGDRNGVRKKPWYLFTPAYWFGSGGKLTGKDAVKTSRGVRHISPSLPRPSEGEEESVDEDVTEEEERMKDLLQHRTGSADALALQADQANAVEVYGLQKVFRAGNLCCCIPRFGKFKKRDFWAIKGSWFAIEKGRLFCLLGPNGAGKTTTINCLTGVLPPSGGDALIYGESLSTPGGMDRIRSIMGVCPQFDVLWGELTAMEHLHIYGRVKGIPKQQLRSEALSLLDEVKLTAAAGLQTATFSGGMKRRLSVALALLGDPLIVFLDECTTGMDPISRRHVWDIIERAKKGRAIVLTTHSMEEADILGDQVAIMARGRVRAFGSPLRLKQRFGSGYQLSVSVLPSSADAAADTALLSQRAADVKAFFKAELGVVPVEESRAWMQYLVPKDREERLRPFLTELEGRRRELGVTDVQISLTSLEEVFLNIARKAELEAAAAEGRSSAKVFLEDGTVLEVPLGDEYVTQPGTGQCYRIKWVQDEAGDLQVLRWTPVDEQGAEIRLPQSSSYGRLAPSGSRGALTGSTATSAPDAEVQMARSRSSKNGRS